MVDHSPRARCGVRPAAFFLAGQPLVLHSFVGSYRQTAIGVVGVLAAIWSIAYWLTGFYPRIYRLSPEVQARTGAKVRIKGRSIEWDRPVGWRAAISLLGFVLWGCCWARSLFGAFC